MRQQFINNMQRDVEYSDSKVSTIPENLIFGLEAYRFGGCWAFTEPALGLINEMFVAGADTFIDMVVGDEIDRVGIQFSTFPFPSHQMKVTYKEGSINSGTYYTAENGHELWLCPALGKFFSTSPAIIYLAFKPIKNV